MQALPLKIRAHQSTASLMKADAEVAHRQKCRQDSSWEAEGLIPPDPCRLLQDLGSLLVTHESRKETVTGNWEQSRCHVWDANHT